MKKIMICVVCILLLAAMSISVAAAGVEATLTPDKTTIGRGDSVVITVSVSEFASCSSGSLTVTFDEKVFTRSENKWLLSDLTMNAPNDKAVFAYGTGNAKTVSGNIYQFKLTAKENAAIAASEISVSLTLKDSSGASSSTTQNVSITISCDHTYNDGEITTPATCDKEGEITKTCSKCGATKKESIAATGHSYNDGEITTPATCDKEGEKTKTCSKCGATEKESIAATGHSYNTGEVTTKPTCDKEGEKTKTCSKCGATEKESIAATGHSYDHACDESCNVCGGKRTITHDYKSKWSADSKGHWHECSVCGVRKDEANHTPGKEATEWDPQTCTTCGYVIQDALGHTHTYDDILSSDKNSHWSACLGCGEKKDVEDHIFDNGCDTTCDACGYERETEHDYTGQLEGDITGHWHACAVCGEVLEVYPHNPGPEATEETDQICLDCGFILQPAGNHVHAPAGDWLSDGQYHWNVCECGEKLDNAPHTWGEGVSNEDFTAYSCTVCGHTYTEDHPDAPGDPGENTGPADEPQQTLPGGDDKTEPNDSDGFPWWILLIIAGVLILGGIIFVIIGILVSRKQVGKYSSK